MAKYLLQTSYSSDGLKGLARDKASGRKAAAGEALASLGGRVENMYLSFGDYDAVLIVDLPDNISAAALSLAVSSSGLVRTRTTPLLTIEEADQALAKAVKYRAPGA